MLRHQATLPEIGAPFKVTSNVISPGITDTELLRSTHRPQDIPAISRSVPLGIAAGEDVGLAAVYLASDAARHVTDATLDSNRGQIIR